jgi:hypothetical protein
VVLCVFIVFACIPLLVLAGSCFGAAPADEKAQQLAREMWQASGGEHWPTVTEIRFTFIVEQEGSSSPPPCIIGTSPPGLIT